MDWGQVLDESIECGVGGITRTMLWLVMLLSGEDLPDEVRSWIEPDVAAHQRAEQVVGNLFIEHTLDRFSHDGEFFFVRSLDRLSDRMRCALDYVFSPTLAEWSFLPLPAPLRPLYYLLRPLRLAAKYGFNPFRRIFGV
jgi:hypothetical protein